MLGWSVPSECPVQNYVDSDGVFHQRVGRVDLGSLNWAYSDTKFIASPNLEDAKTGDWFTIIPNIFSYMYSANCWGGSTGVGLDTPTDKTVNINPNHTIFVVNSEYTDATSFKNAMNGVYLYYELTEEKTISVDGNEAVTQINESLSVIGKCKNLLNPTLGTTTLYGVTCTNNGDGTYSLNGTNSKSDVLYISIGEVEIPNKNLVILGSKNTNVGVYIAGVTPTAYGNKITVSDSDKGKKLKFGFAVAVGATITNEIVKPMLCENLNATYDDFVPYTGKGETLTADVAELKNDLGGLKFSASGTTLTITDGTNTWTLSQ